MYVYMYVFMYINDSWAFFLIIFVDSLSLQAASDSSNAPKGHIKSTFISSHVTEEADWLQWTGRMDLILKTKAKAPVQTHVFDEDHTVCVTSSIAVL